MEGTGGELPQRALYRISAWMLFVGAVPVMAGLPSVYLRQRAESGVLGFALIQVLIFPWIATMNVSNKVLNEGPVSFTIFFAIVSAIVSLGGVLFGVATIRAKIFSRRLGVGCIVLTAASFVLGFLSIPGGGGIAMSWWWATTGTFGVIAYIVALAWFAIELLQTVGHRRRTP